MKKRILAVLTMAVALVIATALPAAARNVNDTHSYSNCTFNYQLKDHGLGKEIGYAALIWVQIFPSRSTKTTPGCSLKLRILYKQPQTEDWAVKNLVFTRRVDEVVSFTNDRSSVGLMRVIATVCKNASCGPSKTTTAQQ